MCIRDSKHADASNLLTTNKAFLAKEAWYAYVVANSANPGGVQATVESRLQAFVTALAANTKTGSNNEVWDYAIGLVNGTAITGTAAQDQWLANNIRDNAIKLFKAETITPSTGNGLTPTAYSGTADTASPKCAQPSSTVTTLTAILTTASANGNMTHSTKSEPFINVTSATTISNAESTMFYMATHTIIRDLSLIHI